MSTPEKPELIRQNAYIDTDSFSSEDELSEESSEDELSEVEEYRYLEDQSIVFTDSSSESESEKEIEEL